MLKIRKEQVEKLGEYITESFFRTAISGLKEKYPGKTEDMNDQEMRDFVEYGVEKGEKYSIIERRDIYFFLEYMMYYGKDFDTIKENGWARKILLIKNLKGEEKIKRMLKKKPL